MSTIRIYSKKTFAIGPGAVRDTDVIDSFITVPGSFQDMPEIYKDDPTFKLAVSAHEIEIIDHPTTIPVNVAVEEEEFEEAKLDPINEYKEKLKVMKKEEVKEEAEKYNAKFDENDALKVNKKRVFEAFKLSLTEAENASDPVSE